MRNLLALLPEFKKIIEAFHNHDAPVVVNGAAGAFKAVLASALEKELFSNKTICILVPGIDQVSQWKQDLECILPERKVLVFEPSEAIPFEVIAASREPAAGRLQVLAGLCDRQRQPLIILTPAEALLSKLIPPKEWAEASLSFEVGKNYDLSLLSRLLMQRGYERKDLVTASGTFALRGDILDIYSFQDPPVRLEFWGDTLSSIREFEPESQRSKAKLDGLTIWPAREFIYKSEKVEKALAKMQETYKMRRSQLKNNRDVQRHFSQRYASLREMAIEGSGFSLHLLQPYFYHRQSSLLDYLPENTLIILDESRRISEQWNSSNALLESDYKRLLQEGRALAGWQEHYFRAEELRKNLNRFPLLAFSRLTGNMEDLESRTVISLTTKEMQPFLGRPDLLVPEVHGWLRKKTNVLLLVQTETRLRHLENDLRNRELTGTRAQKWMEFLEQGRLQLGIGSLSRGFEVPGLLAVITGEELYGKKTVGLRRKRPYSKEGLGPKPDFAPGDYIVHPHHGIGRFLGIKRINSEEETKDYLEVAYAGGDRLYVPVTQADIIQGYVGPEGNAPKLSRLGGADWTRTKQKVKKKVRELACNLLELYAKRKSGRGFVFSPDTPWQREFEELFPYEETPDQLRAIAEVKTDMEKALPMDRLVCGDVGFGKTEVALRAAFKAVQDNKQVAVLVPTTVLAQQHFHTFEERFSGYPVRIEVLSRFRTSSEQKKIIMEVSKGLVDIIIGTHRLLSGDVKFSNLGLLVIDEEQRFGVNHKERIKALRTNVDALTLTATPIPRTLQMSLAGVRDMSMIETPPQDRLPIQTYVLEYSSEVVRDAILREIKRGGQVYYVHNRVQTIVHTAAYLQSLVPEVTFRVAHGQMKEDALEKVMWDFFNKKFDCLVCTTIIENGLDLPNVNTLLVDQSDRFGLSQLYQLRGRVGRSNKLAYAYFTFEGDKILSEQAEKRLRALEEFTEFGSGFKLALRDLEIRGAGNLLGPEQHGHVAAVGFDMFNQLLTEVVREMQGIDLPEQKQDAQNWDLQVDFYLPDDYVPEPAQKVEIYRRLALVQNVEEVNDLEAEVCDRYGPLPEPVVTMFALARLRVCSQEMQITEVDRNNRFLIVRYGDNFNPTREDINRWAAVFGKRLCFAVAGRFEIKLDTKGLSPQELLEKLGSVLLAPFSDNTKQWSVRN